MTQEQLSLKVKGKKASIQSLIERLKTEYVVIETSKYLKDHGEYNPHIYVTLVELNQ